jgi:hypothetical protein
MRCIWNEMQLNLGCPFVVRDVLLAPRSKTLRSAAHSGNHDGTSNCTSPMNHSKTSFSTEIFARAVYTAGAVDLMLTIPTAIALSRTQAAHNLSCTLPLSSNEPSGMVHPGRKLELSYSYCNLATHCFVSCCQRYRGVRQIVSGSGASDLQQTSFGTD